MSKKYMFINLFAQVISFGVSFIISFFVTPRIVGVVGKETYGFLGLANNFAGYVTVVTVALNALAGRFVTICIHRENEREANEYFNSVMISNALVAAILVVPAALFVINLEKILNLPADNVLDIKLTFAFVFLGFFINLICSILSVATYARNKIYLASIRNIESNLLRIAVIIAAFAFFEPRISFVSGALLIANTFVAFTNYRYTKRLLPEISLSRKYFSLKKVKELIISGCWNSITALSNMLLEGLDLLISNLFIGPQAMGVVAIVKTIPNMLYQVMYSITGVFLPQLTIYYAKNNKERMLGYIDFSSKVVGMLMAMPVAFIIVYGKDFFSIWLPSEDACLLLAMSIFSLSELLFAGSVNIMYNLYNVTNKLKAPAVATLVTGVLNTVIVLTLLATTDLGVYAVVAVSSLLGIIRNLLFNVPYSARCINEKKRTFYKMVFRSVGMVLTASVVGGMVKLLLDVAQWKDLIVSGVLLCVMSLVINVLVFCSGAEKKIMIESVKNKMWRKKNGTEE